VVDSHATSNPAISDVKRGKKNGLKLKVSLSLSSLSVFSFSLKYLFEKIRLLIGMRRKLDGKADIIN